MATATAAQSASIQIEVSEYFPSPIRPPWFSNLQRRLLGSIVPRFSTEHSSGRWLNKEVAGAALRFFEEAADLLPEEPYIYSSRLGDLVAEFKCAHGTMTAIVSPAFALLFATVGGLPIERRVLGGENVRDEVRKLTLMLRSGRHGDMDTTE